MFTKSKRVPGKLSKIYLCRIRFIVSILYHMQARTYIARAIQPYTQNQPTYIFKKLGMFVACVQ